MSTADTQVQVQCRHHDHGIGCTVITADGGIVMMDGDWPSIEVAEQAILEWAGTAHERETLVDEAARALQRSWADARITERKPLREVADAIGVSISTLSSWERGRAYPNAEQTAVWLAVLGLVES
jgi:chromosomal replication initiation ATPase DnaA